MLARQSSKLLMRRGSSVALGSLPKALPALAPTFSWRSVGASMLFPSWSAVPAVMGMAPLERVQEALARTPTAAVCGLAPKQLEEECSAAVWQSSTVKKRAMKMNKHKLKKRRKLLRMNTKQSRG